MADPWRALCVEWESRLLQTQVIARIVSTEAGPERTLQEAIDGLHALKDTMIKTVMQSQDMGLLDTLVDALARAVTNDYPRLHHDYSMPTIFEAAFRAAYHHGTHTIKARPAMQVMAYAVYQAIGGDLEEITDMMSVTQDHLIHLLLDKIGPTPCRPLARLLYRNLRYLPENRKLLGVFQVCHVRDVQLLLEHPDEDLESWLPKVVSTPRTTSLFKTICDKLTAGGHTIFLTSILANVAEREPGSFWWMVTSVGQITNDMSPWVWHRFIKLVIYHGFTNHIDPPEVPLVPCVLPHTLAIEYLRETIRYLSDQGQGQDPKLFVPCPKYIVRVLFGDWASLLDTTVASCNTQDLNTFINICWVYAMASMDPIAFPLVPIYRGVPGLGQAFLSVIVNEFETITSTGRQARRLTLQGFAAILRLLPIDDRQRLEKREQICQRLKIAYSGEFPAESQEIVDLLI
jgi:hypothetical protein